MPKKFDASAVKSILSTLRQKEIDASDAKMKDIKGSKLTPMKTLMGQVRASGEAARKSVAGGFRKRVEEPVSSMRTEGGEFKAKRVPIIRKTKR